MFNILLLGYLMDGEFNSDLMYRCAYHMHIIRSTTMTQDVVHMCTLDDVVLVIVTESG